MILNMLVHLKDGFELETWIMNIVCIEHYTCPLILNSLRPNSSHYLCGVVAGQWIDKK